MKKLKYLVGAVFTASYLVVLLTGCGSMRKYDSYHKEESPLFLATRHDLRSISGKNHSGGGLFPELNALIWTISIPGYILDLPISLVVDTVTSPYDAYESYTYKSDVKFWNNVIATADYSGSLAYRSHVSEHFAYNYTNYRNDIKISVRETPIEFNKLLVKHIIMNDSISEKGTIPSFLLRTQNEDNVDEDILRSLIEPKLCSFAHYTYFKHPKLTSGLAKKLLTKLIKEGKYNSHSADFINEECITVEDLVDMTLMLLDSEAGSESMKLYLEHMARNREDSLQKVTDQTYVFYQKHYKGSFYIHSNLFKYIRLNESIMKELVRQCSNKWGGWHEPTEYLIAVAQQPNLDAESKAAIVEYFNQIKSPKAKLLVYVALKDDIGGDLSEELIDKLLERNHGKESMYYAINDGGLGKDEYDIIKQRTCSDHQYLYKDIIHRSDCDDAFIDKYFAHIIGGSPNHVYSLDDVLDRFNMDDSAERARAIFYIKKVSELIKKHSKEKNFISFKRDFDKKLKKLNLKK